MRINGIGFYAVSQILDLDIAKSEYVFYVEFGHLRFFILLPFRVQYVV